jgi:hypothetical protein
MYVPCTSVLPACTSVLPPCTPVLPPCTSVLHAHLSYFPECSENVLSPVRSRLNSKLAQQQTGKACVAQWIARWTSNPKVAGSSPAVGTIQQPINQQYVGSYIFCAFLCTIIIKPINNQTVMLKGSCRVGFLGGRRKDGQDGLWRMSGSCSGL